MSDYGRPLEDVLLTSDVMLPLAVATLSALNEDIGPGGETFDMDSLRDEFLVEEESVLGRFTTLSTSSA